MIVFLTEEQSMRVTLRALLAGFRPNLLEGLDWQILVFEGKADLEKKFADRMRCWNHGDPHFVILRDNDGGDCQVLKARLADKAATSGKRFHIRIVCQELESWFLGDCLAVTAAYSSCGFSNDTAKYRNPDRINNASQELASLTGDFAKVNRAAFISPHLDPPRNRSRSFQVLFETIQQLFG